MSLHLASPAANQAPILGSLLSMLLKSPEGQVLLDEMEQRLECRLTAQLDAKNTSIERSKLITAVEAGKIAKRNPVTISALRKSGTLTGYKGEGGRWLYNQGEIFDFSAANNPANGKPKRVSRRNQGTL